MRYALIALSSFTLAVMIPFVGPPQSVTTTYASSVVQKPQSLGVVIHVSEGADDIPDVLDLLRSYHAHVTFVVDQDWAKRNPLLVTRMTTEGHTVKYNK